MKRPLYLLLFILVIVFSRITPIFASDTEWIAFDCALGDQNSSEIFKMLSDGTNLQQLTFNQRYDYSPEWSPRADQIAFQSAQWSSLTNIFADNAIHRMTADGGHVEQLTYPQRLSHAYSPTWSPDGEWIAFISFSGNPATRYELNKMRVDGTEVTPLTSGLLANNPTWSPDGEWIAFVSYNDTLYRIHPDGTGLQLLMTTDELVFSPQWSPNSEWIVFLADLTEIYRIRENGDDQQLLTTARYVRAVTWSPSGTLLAYSVSNGEKDTLFSTAADGSNKQLIYSAVGEILNPVWSQDEQQLFFSYGGTDAENNYHSHQIYRIGVNGSELTQLAQLPCDVWYFAVSPAPN